MKGKESKLPPACCSERPHCCSQGSSGITQDCWQIYILLLHEPPTPAQAIQQGHRQLGRELQGICLWKRLVLMLPAVYYCCKKPINSHILPQRFGASPCWRLDITPDKSSAACRAHSLFSVMCLQQGGGMAQNEYLQRRLLHCIHQKTVTCICLIYESSKSSCNS